jgi:hypothetical protein
MPGLRLRMSNLVMLLIVIVPVMSLVTQRRREMVSRLRVQILAKENLCSHAAFHDHEFIREREVARVQPQVDRLSDLGKDDGAGTP